MFWLLYPQRPHRGQVLDNRSDRSMVDGDGKIAGEERNVFEDIKSAIAFVRALSLFSIHLSHSSKALCKVSIVSSSFATTAD